MEKTRDVLDRLEKRDDEYRSKTKEEDHANSTIPRAVGEFLSVAGRSINAKNIVELGTSEGYSAVWLGLVAESNKGKLTTYELDKTKAKQAENNLKEAGLKDISRVITGSISESNLPEKIDLIFLDHDPKDFLSDLQLLKSRLVKGGSIIANNAIVNFESLRPYIEYIRTSKEFDSVMIPIGRGLELSYKYKDDEPAVFSDEELVR